MNSKIFKHIVFLLILASTAACKKNGEVDDFCTPCDDKEVFYELKDRQAYVLKWPAHEVLADTFYFELVNSDWNQDMLWRWQFSIRSFFPFCNVPEPYRKEGLSVKISGKSIMCLELYEPGWGPNFPIFFELESIEENHDYLCYFSCCEEKEIIKIFQNETGFIRKRYDGSMDILIYYFFEPLTPYNEFSDQLLIVALQGNYGYGLEKYAGKAVRISGRITNCILPIDFGSSTFEHNILELSSITIN